jgi:hypothetical protein
VIGSLVNGKLFLYAQFNRYQAIVRTRLGGSQLTNKQSTKGQKVWEITLDMPSGSVRLIRIWAHGEISAINKAKHRYPGARVRSAHVVVDDNLSGSS